VTVRGALVYLVLWSPLVLIYALLIGGPNQQPIDQAVTGALMTVGMAALLGLPSLWWARRLGVRLLDTPEGASRRGLLAGHVAGALLYALLWAAYIVQGINDVLGNLDETLATVRPWILWQLFFGMIVYAVLASVVWAALSGERSRQRDARLREVEAERTRAELAVLRARVDPHFLYNALHTATSLVRHHPAAAEQALEHLASLLRYVLDPARGARELVPLDEELQFVELYLAIERTRLGERLQVVMDIDDEARDMPVPSLSLQPLVENAIRHGLAPRPQGGTITVRALARERQLELSVSDDGLGADPAAHDRASRVDSGESARGAGASSSTSTGIGLDALRKRLAARFGAAATLDVQTAPGAGFSVRLLLPV
jgi:two-component system LytT family sensor kinase